jgi:hypothetical protein
LFGAILSLLTGNPSIPVYGVNPLPENNFRAAMGNKYKEAFLYLLSNTWMADTLVAYHVDPNFAYAVVFPELVRYSWIRDKMEMAGLFSLYIQYGDKYANFSVGRFQMKPSFVFQIEKDAIESGILKISTKEGFGVAFDKESRYCRVKRLDSDVWQVRYLVIFIKVLDRIYASKRWNNVDEKLKFYATAYNYGYRQSEGSIKKQIKNKSFYTSFLSGGPRYCYADISSEMYQLLIRSINR